MIRMKLYHEDKDLNVELNMDSEFLTIKIDRSKVIEVGAKGGKVEAKTPEGKLITLPDELGGGALRLILLSPRSKKEDGVAFK
jgi:hypothetical protein